MAKDKRDKKSRERLLKARARLAELEEAYMTVQAEEEQKVQSALNRAEKRVARVREKYEKQAEKVARREEKVLGIVAPRTLNGEVTSPEAAADTLAEAIAEAPPEPDIPLVMGDGAQEPTTESGEFYIPS